LREHELVSISNFIERLLKEDIAKYESNKCTRRPDRTKYLQRFLSRQKKEDLSE